MALARRKWTDEVSRFVQSRRAARTVGELWLRRMSWELGRVPRLSAVAAPDTALTVPGDLPVAYLEGLRERMRWEKPTFAIHFAALRQFLRWAGNPLAAEAGAWRLPSGEPSHRRWLSREDLLALLAHATGRARILVALEGLNGLRRVEVLRLRVKDVFLPESTLRVLGKGRNGGKWRRIPLHPRVAPLLERWVRGKAPEARIFEMSRSSADLLLAGAARAAGLTGRGVRVSHHDLRRTFGRLAARAGMDLVQIKNLFGHASVDMTAHYIGLDADEMRDGLSRLDDLLDTGGARRRAASRATGNGRRPPPFPTPRGRGPGRRRARRRRRPPGSGAAQKPTASRAAPR